MAETEKNNLERTLWDAANKLRGNINSSDYKYVVLGLIFIKYVSDAFETQLAKYKAEGFDETDEKHSGRIGDIAIYGQELNTTTWRLAKMNMAIRGIDADIRQGDTIFTYSFERNLENRINAK
ncbi:MAG: type I restriction-modification system subunit M [Tannerella sp.]|jgi:type I restriction-modification system DNA methylase subunit|nr:type I restriction-modification system subunit M [Tannerella sp.]